MFLKKQKIKVNVSELVLYLKCPRKVYYSCRGHETLSKGTVPFAEHLVLKELGLKFPDLLGRYSSKDDDFLVELETIFSGISEELPLIYPEESAIIGQEIMDEATSGLRSSISEIGHNLLSSTVDGNAGKLREQLMSAEPGHPFHSEKLGLSGIPDCIVDISGTLSPLVVRTGQCPQSGVWSNDRLHIASLAMLMEKDSGTLASSGIVVYARQGNVRNVNIRPNDRRQVLQVLGRVRRIRDGSLPDRKESSFCGDCAYLEMCEVRSSLASKFF
ncbi:MAG: Dna2/Cas4 domain-containing protein [Methanosarcinaceae archaeon]|nr:Dna2/Cas4 domain-containing protein [Methanosarcinaceae archaeon]